MRHVIILAALWSLLLPATSDPAGAEPYFARNKLRVFETADPGVMEVLAQPGSAGAQFFCAAGEYARGPLGARSTDRVVVVAPASRSADPRFRGQRTVKFALVPRGTPLPRQRRRPAQRRLCGREPLGRPRSVPVQPGAARRPPLRLSR